MVRFLGETSFWGGNLGSGCCLFGMSRCWDVGNRLDRVSRLVRVKDTVVR